MIVLVFFLIGVGIGFIFRKKSRIIQVNNRISYILLALLIFIMGVSTGSQQNLLGNFKYLGVNSFLLAFGGIIGSILFILPISRRKQEKQE